MYVFVKTLYHKLYKNEVFYHESGHDLPIEIFLEMLLRNPDKQTD